MIKIKKIQYLLILICISTPLFAGKIVYPWRATTAIVKQGETFEVWFSADDGQTVNAVELQSAYLKVNPAITNTVNQIWVYDKWSENTCNTKLTITVPTGTPSDRYDLVLKTSTGDEVSPAAVKVIKEYKTSFYVFHISDVHRWQGSYDTQKINQNVAVTIDIANIIDPEMVFETGDNHYQNTNSLASTKQRTTDYYNGYMNGTEFIKGLNQFSAPVFSVPGNHDTPLKNYQLEPGYPNPGYTKTPSLAWNDLYGLQAHNFAYGNARFIGLNNAWFLDESTGIPNFEHQTDEAKVWLNQVGKGTMRIGYCHVMTPVPLKAFYEPLLKANAPLNFIMAGHCHWAGNTHSIKDYPDVKITHSTYPLREITRKAPFNLYKIDLLTNKYTPVGDSIGAQTGLETADNYATARLKLLFDKPNDGTSTSNTATIVNKFNFPVTNARVRFVVPKGNQYYVRNATIIQEFDGTNVHVIDATYNLDANSTYSVTLHQGVQVDLCPEDPNKMDPGICGCGVPEGSCPVAATDISLNTTEIRMVLNTTRQMKATIMPANATNKTINWKSSNSAIVAVDADGTLTAVSGGNVTIEASTYDNSKYATATVTVLPATNIYQAEDAEFEGPVVAANQTGYNGSGFLDYTNTSNDYIKWNVFVPSDGTYNLAFRYAVASGTRPLKLTVNDVVKVASLAFPVTGSWSNWSTVTTSQALVEGNNTIMLTAIGSSGGNFDELTISGNGINASKNITSTDVGKSIRIFRNEISPGKLCLELKGYDNLNNVLIKIRNITGQTVYQKFLNPSDCTVMNVFDVCPNAMYILTVESEGSVLSGKISLN